MHRSPFDSSPSFGGIPLAPLSSSSTASSATASPAQKVERCAERSNEGSKPPLIRPFTFDGAAKESMELPPRSGHSSGESGERPPLVAMPVPQTSLLTRPSSYASTISAGTSSPELPRQSSSTSLSHMSTDGSLAAQVQEQYPPQQHTQQPQQSQEPHWRSAAPMPSHQPGAFAASRSLVHVVWDLSSVPLPVTPSVGYCLERVRAVVDSCGFLASFKCISYTNTSSGSAGGSIDVGSAGNAGPLPMATRRALLEQGVELEEVFKSASTPGTIDLGVLLAIMACLVAAQQQQTRNCTLVLMSNQDALARSITLLRRSQLFDRVIVIHWDAVQGAHGYASTPLLPLQSSEPQALVRHATAAYEWTGLLRQGLPPAASIIFVPPRSGHMSTEPSGFNQRRMDRKSMDAHSRSTPSIKDLQAQLNQAGQQRFQSHSSNLSSYNTSAASSGFISRASTPSVSSSRGSSAHSTPGSSRSSSISVAASPPLMTDASGRTCMGSLLDTPLKGEAGSTDLSDLSVELVLERLPPTARAYMRAFLSVLAYCESERIIPRESVLKKRLQDTPAGASEVDFEQVLELAVCCGLAAVEGQTPQRIIYPSGGHTADGSAPVRKFECADFYQPTQRLTVEQTKELLAWLNRFRPEIDRGRFGFAQHLSMHAPDSIRALPHGVLVELVQLLLNQKILLFRKGRVSVNSNLAYADLHALAALSVASKPHTALLSTLKGPAGAEAAAQLKGLYAQIATDVNRYNEQRSVHPAFTAPGPSPSLSPPIGGPGPVPSIEQFAHVRESQQRRNSMGQVQVAQPLEPYRARTSSDPTSPMPWRLQQQQRQQQYTPQRFQQAGAGADSEQPQAQLEPIWTHSHADASSIGGSEAHTVLAPAAHSQPNGRVTEAARPRFVPPPPYAKEPGVTYGQLFAHKLMMSNWGVVPPLLSGPPRFPWSALWHLDLSSLRAAGSPTATAGRWSATASFDVSGTLHTFSALATHADMREAMETLAHQMLQDDIVWRMAWACMMEELKAKRRAGREAGDSGSKPAMRLLIKERNELAEMERAEHGISERMAAEVRAQLAANAVLRLDALLSELQQAPMLYSCEQVDIQSMRGKRTVWSVAAQLSPSALLGDPTLQAEPIAAAAIKDDKMDAKLECASALLMQVQHLRPELLSGMSATQNTTGGPLNDDATAGGGSAETSSTTATPARATLSARAPEWVPPSAQGVLTATSTRRSGVSSSSSSNGSVVGAGAEASSQGSEPGNPQPKDEHQRPT